MYTYLLPVDEHFPAQVTYRGCGILALVKRKFGDLGILNRVENSPFRHFFNGSDRPLQFSGAIIHELLLRKIVTENKDEIHFGLGQKACRLAFHIFQKLFGCDIYIYIYFVKFRFRFMHSYLSADLDGWSIA